MSMRRIAVLAGPQAMALDEFEAIDQLPGVDRVWARAPADCRDVHWIVLPGSRRASVDLAWMRAQGLDTAVATHAARGCAVLGIGNGLQMLGEALIDVQSVDGNAPGLGLLALVTQFQTLETPRTVEARFGALRGAWEALSGLCVSGQQFQSGQAAAHPAMVAKGHELHEVLPGLGWQHASGHVLGVNLHGMLTQPQVLQALFASES